MHGPNAACKQKEVQLDGEAIAAAGIIDVTIAVDEAEQG